MDVLMLRLDVFDHTHQYLLDFWKEIMYTFGDEDALVFTTSFASYDDIARKVSPEVYVLCESYTNLQGTLNELGDAQRHIREDLKGQMVYTDTNTHDLIVLHPLTKEEEKLKDEFYEINDSTRMINREMENLSKVILKERQKLWNHIDTIIIDSYKQLLFDITGSDDFVQAFMDNMRIVGIMENLRVAKRKHDYEFISGMIGIIDEQIGNWIRDIEQLVGAVE